MLAVAAALAFSAAGAGIAEAAPPEVTQAAADGVKTIEFTKSAESLSEFWTPERLRIAAENPMPAPTVTAEAAKRAHENAQKHQRKTQGRGPVAANAAAPEGGAAVMVSPLTTNGTIADLSRSDLASPLGWQVNIAGRLFFSTGGSGYSSCTASAIVSNNKNSIWTAGHCIHGGKDKGFYSNFVFAPGYDETAPWGFWPLQKGIVSSAWADDSDFLWGDVGGGIVAAPEAEYGNLQDWTGAYGYRFNGDSDIDDVTSLGYPADGYNRTSAELHEGTKPMYCHGNAVDAGNWNPLDNRLKLACDMGGGASGGPMIINFGVNSQIVGTNSHRLADNNNQWVENYLYSSNHGGNAAGVINWLNAN
ncbi:trypsin-like serine peptidase [Kitasatospora sp. NPDC058115]|uniref:trypsin-like serine peptidase n=1 Tax=Kitasatospora sp. NPDC058115 TaxID=3346347 RepID=UPI0036D82922